MQQSLMTGAGKLRGPHNFQYPTCASGNLDHAEAIILTLYDKTTNTFEHERTDQCTISLRFENAHRKRVWQLGHHYPKLQGFESLQQERSVFQVLDTQIESTIAAQSPLLVHCTYVHASINSCEDPMKILRGKTKEAANLVKITRESE